MTHADHRAPATGATFEPRVTPWQAAALEVAPSAPFDEAARAFVRAAVLAPSGHNTQPWRFAVCEPDVLVFADPARRLPVADPDDRELTMSLGAAVMNLRVAAAHAGYGSAVTAGASEGEAARVRLTAGGADAGLAALFSAVTARRTWRLAFAGAGLPAEAWEALRAVGALGAARALLIDDETRRDTLVALIKEGDHRRMSDKGFRRELAAWIRPAHTDASDGLAGDVLGLSPFASDLAAWSTRAFDMGKSIARKDAALATESAALVVIVADDEPAALIDAGQLLERILLTAALHGVSASYFNLPVEVPELRERIQETVGSQSRPQLLFRLGRSGDAELAPSPRRPLSAVMGEKPNPFGRAIAKALQDDAFQAKLIAEPGAVLKSEGVAASEGVSVRVVEDADTLRHLVLPIGEVLADAELGAVSAGYTPTPAARHSPAAPGIDPSEDLE